MIQTKSYLLIIAIFSFLSPTLHAEDRGESSFLLKEAMMESNADYNKHRKKMNEEEFERADEWGERGSSAIIINQKVYSSKGFEEFKNQNQSNSEPETEVSAHTDKKIDKLED